MLFILNSYGLYSLGIVKVQSRKYKLTAKNMSYQKEDNKNTRKILVLAIILALIAGLIGGVISGLLLNTPGPQGDKGDTGDTGAQGTQGIQGLQGTQGANGNDSIMQTIQKRNETQIATDNVTTMQWVNISDLDASMEITINIQQNAKIFAEFSATHTLKPPASIWIRIVIDGLSNSSKYVCSTGPPASGTYGIPGHAEFLTDQLNAGTHTINVQFLIETGSPTISDRTLTAFEISA